MLDIRKRWIAVLVNQAILLLTRENSIDGIHERANLYRSVMDNWIHRLRNFHKEFGLLLNRFDNKIIRNDNLLDGSASKH